MHRLIEECHLSVNAKLADVFCLTHSPNGSTIQFGIPICICVRHYAGQKILGVSVAQPITCHHYTGECVFPGRSLGIPGPLLPLPGSSLGL